MPLLRRCPTAELTDPELREIRALLEAAFGDDDGGRFSEEDWQHALGGIHAIVEAGGRIVAHASVVARTLVVAGVPLRTGYLEAVATRPGEGRRGYASMAVRDLDEVIRAEYELGALSTGVPVLYERLGWERWRGPAFVRRPDGELERMPDEDDGIMVLRTPASPPPDLATAIVADWRDGDIW